MSVEPLETRRMLACTIYQDLANGLDHALKDIGDNLGSVAYASNEIPFLGETANERLNEVAASLDKLRPDLKQEITNFAQESTADAIKSALYSLLGPQGNIKLLGDTNHSAQTAIAQPQDITEDDVFVQLDAENCSIDIEMRLTQAVEVATMPANFDFDLGLPAVPFYVASTAGVNVGVGFDYQNLKFGYAPSQGGFYLVTTQHNELSIDLEATFEPPQTPQDHHLEATVGFLKATLVDGHSENQSNPQSTAKHSTLSIGIDVNLTPNGLDVERDASADLYFQIETDISDNFPSVSADFVMHWFGPEATDQQPEVRFENVTMLVGTFASEMVGPIVQTIEPILEPITPVIDVLTARLPVLSDLSEFVGLGEVSIQDIVDFITDVNGFGGYNELVRTISTIVDVVDFISGFQCTDDACTNVRVNFGDFDLGQNGDLRTLPAALDIDKLTKDVTNLVVGGGGTGFGLDGLIQKLEESEFGGTDLGNQLVENLRNLNGLEYKFPILDDPANGIFKLFVGQDVDLFTFRVQFNGNGGYDETFGTSIGLDVGLNGSVSPQVKILLGYDTFGLRKFFDSGDPADLLAGFWLDKDSKIHLDATIAALAGIDTLFFDVGVKGGLEAGIHLDAPNVDTDGDPQKIHVREELGECLFDTQGALGAFLDIFVQIGVDIPLIGFVGYEETFRVAEETLLDYSLGCTAKAPNPFKEPENLQLATEISPGVWRLNMGPDWLQRNYETTKNLAQIEDEVFTVLHDNPQPGDPTTGEAVRVSAFGFTQRFVGVEMIVADAGTKKDIITIGPDVMADVELKGGSGNDQLTYRGGGTSEMRGGSGNDQLIHHGSAQSKMWGEGGDDRLFGGTGPNMLYGGSGDDELTSGAGPNVSSHIEGGAGDDLLIGGKGPNTLIGGDDQDTLVAGPLNDTLNGGSGDDDITVGAGNSQVFAGPGDDKIAWTSGDGNLTLDGGGGRDSLGLTGSDVSDTFVLSKYQVASLRVSAQTGNPAVPRQLVVNAVEKVAVDGTGGSDFTLVQPLTNTRVEEVGINLSDFIDPDYAEDQVIVLGTPTADVVTVEAVDVLVEACKVNGVSVSPQQCIKDNVQPHYGGSMKISGLPDYSVWAMNYEDDVRLHTQSGHDTVTVKSITGPTLIDAQGDNDQINVQAAQSMDYLAELEVEAGQGHNALHVDYSNSLAATTSMMTSTRITGNLLPAINFAATGGTYGGGVSLTGGAHDDIVNVQNTLPGLTTAVNGGGGDDSINVSSDAPALSGNLDGILGQVDINTGAGTNNTLTVSDRSATSGNHQVYIDSINIQYFAGPTDNTTIRYQSIGGNLHIVLEGADNAALEERFIVGNPLAELTINGNAGDETIDVGSTSHQTSVDAGAGDDTINVGYMANTLDLLQGPLHVSGMQGTDRLSVSDTATNSGSTYTLSANALVRSPAVSIGFDDSVEHLNVTTTNLPDALEVNNVPSSTRVFVDMSDDDNDTVVGPNANSQWVVGSTNGGSVNGVVFVDVENLVGGDNDDHFQFRDGQRVTGGVLGSLGHDTVDCSLFADSIEFDLQSKTVTYSDGAVMGFDEMERLMGGNGSDLLVGSSQNNSWQINQDDGGLITTTTQGQIHFESIENLTGGPKNDVFRFIGSTSISGVVAGQGGTDTLNYSGSDSPVVVDLALGMGTAIRSSTRDSVSGIEDVIGGHGNDLILGDQWNNVLRGNGGNDILLGRRGKDEVFGDEGRDLVIGGSGADGVLRGGSGEDLLIGDSTAHAKDIDALQAILLEWARKDLGYWERVGNLTKGGGLNGAVTLDPTAWIDDGNADTLRGDGMSDWFWANLVDDVIQDLEQDELVSGNVPQKPPKSKPDGLGDKPLQPFKQQSVRWL